jgi:hypothetical protein
MHWRLAARAAIRHRHAASLGLAKLGWRRAVTMPGWRLRRRAVAALRGGDRWWPLRRVPDPFWSNRRRGRALRQARIAGLKADASFEEIITFIEDELGKDHPCLTVTLSMKISGGGYPTRNF